MTPSGKESRRAGCIDRGRNRSRRPARILSNRDSTWAADTERTWQRGRRFHSLAHAPRVAHGPRWPRPGEMELRILAETFAVARLAADAAVPAWVGGKDFLAVVRTRNELSIVCRDEAVPAQILEVQRAFKAFAVIGTLDFTHVGIIADVARPLADAGIPIFAISTYDTDHFLVRADRLDDAKAALLAGGHTLR